jgi:hypothetical protein
MNQILDRIDRETGLQYGKDYTFVVGTHYPFFFRERAAFTPATNRAGYIVRKGDVELNIHTTDPIEEYRQIVDFLKQDLVVSK